MNNKAILTYINSGKDLIEFSFLWKTWLMWDINEQWDIIVISEVDLKDYEHDNLTVYQNFEDNTENLAKYDFLFKTECGSFLTPNIKEFEPWKDKMYLGIGTHYQMGGDETLTSLRAIIRKIADRLNLPYRDISHIGNSIIGGSKVVINTLKTQKAISGYITTNGWKKEEDGVVGGWHRKYVNEYALDLAVNSILQPISVHQGSIDVWCGFNKITSLDLHITCNEHSNQDGVFSKEKFHSGELPKIKYNKIPATTTEYCFFIANSDLGYLKSLVENTI